MPKEEGSTTKFYKTVIRIEVLSEQEFDPQDLEALNYEITHGHASGLVKTTSQKEISKRALIRQCRRHGTDPGFFLES